MYIDIYNEKRTNEVRTQILKACIAMLRVKCYERLQFLDDEDAAEEAGGVVGCSPRCRAKASIRSASSCC